ncbi:hypothetical protein [Saccharibacillus alkalitolerans]|uniref:Uncharacterized protein n=1 Tax=Saccharibacillus alkalitolerans TaxID=2705290 RepID=A0ABX0FDY5_9BACL|nr:hypothetical protein [Saccharibacillus alkalitolerans]NGZ77966.1 hypothetical protein [Saccharibacillus alkalitolerans]
MNERKRNEAEKPAWYKRAGEGPFGGKLFTERMMENVEREIREHGEGAAAKRRTRRGKKAARTAAAAAALLMLTGGGLAIYGALDNGGAGTVPAAEVSESAKNAEAAAHTDDIVPPDGVSAFRFGGRRYFYDDSAARIREWTRAVRTTEGIVWTPAPDMTGSAKTIYGMSMDDRPRTPFKLYLSGTENQELREADSLKLLELPLTDGEPYRHPYIDDLWAAGRYAVYATSLHVEGAPQLKNERIWMIDTAQAGISGRAEPRFVTDYHSAGGETFELAYDAEANVLIYFRSAPGETGTDSGLSEAVAYHPDTGKRETLDRGGAVYGTRGDVRTVTYPAEAGGSYTADLLND